MTTKTDIVTLLKNEDGDYFIEIPQAICEQMGLSDVMEYDIVTDGKNGLEIRRGLKNNDCENEC